MDDFATIMTVVFVGIILTSFNVLTFLVVVTDKNLRNRPSNYPILSFLIASAIQGCSAAPFYIYKKMTGDKAHDSWVCDAYRFPYIYCGHMMKVSLTLVALDRLLAVRYPFTYSRHVNKIKYIFLITVFWIITLIIDIVPFLNNAQNAECEYQPTHIWGLSVIVAFNLIPFVIIGASYISIWLVASKIAKHEQSMRPSIENKKFFKKSTPKYQKAIAKTLDSLKQKVEMKATITSLALLVVYITCWGPIGVTYMVDHFCNNCLSDDKNLDVFRAVIKYLCFSSSLSAPIVYCWMNHQYRKAAFKMLGCRKYDKNVFLEMNNSTTCQDRLLISKDNETNNSTTCQDKLLLSKDNDINTKTLASSL